MPGLLSPRFSRYLKTMDVSLTAYEGRIEETPVLALAGTRRLNLNKYCKRDYAILGKVLERETVDDWVKFSLNIQSVFKRARDSRLRRTNTFLWVPVKDLACKCPKIKTNKSYLILGKEKEGEHTGLTITQRSIVIEWKDEWNNRMRRFQRRSRQCK
ncbi:hypothetical protein J6590_054495 [Homalodisca vitripennis]|nr:hypothetical protein J6590_054495 [Homalodisca vitripennis]